ncbi:hypothetical protein [Spirosoma areae]
MQPTPIEHLLHELVAMVEAGQAVEAIDRFYHPDVVMQENHTEPRVGKAINRAYEVEFLGKITAIREYKALNVTVGSGVSAITWACDFDHADWGPTRFTEINVQEWQEGLIIRETFFYQL